MAVGLRGGLKSCDHCRICSSCGGTGRVVGEGTAGVNSKGNGGGNFACVVRQGEGW